MDCLNMTNATIQEKTILMLIERIENLEKELYETKKNNIICAIAACDNKVGIWADIFLFFLGIDIPTRIKIKENHKLTKTFLPQTIPKRAIQLYKLLDTSNKPFWESDFNVENSWDLYSDENGYNIYKILQKMTLKELEDYWHYRISWTKWL